MSSSPNGLSTNLTLPLALTTSSAAAAKQQQLQQHQQITTTSPLYHLAQQPQQAVTIAATSTTNHHHQQQQFHHQHHHHINEMTMQTLKSVNGKFVTATTSNGGSPNTMAINLTTSSECGGIITSPTHHLIVAAASHGSHTTASMPLNMNASSSHTGGGGTPPIQSIGGQSLQIISTNSLSSFKEMNTGTGKNGIRMSELGRHDSSTPGTLVVKKQDLGNGGGGGCVGTQMELVKMDTSSAEPPTKVIKLINGSTIALASVDKDHKIIGSTGQTLTLQQVVGGGGLVVSPIPILTSQGLRVIGQSPNGLATIELSGSPMTSQHQQQQLQSHLVSSRSGTVQVTSSGQVVSSSSSSSLATNGAQLHKLLVSGTSATDTSSVTTVMSSDLARLPGGAELNILPANTNGSTTYYRSQKLAIVNNGISLKGNYHGVNPFFVVVKKILFLYYIKE